MIRELENAFEIFYDLHLDWKNQEKEQKYIKLIENIAKDTKNLPNILNLIIHNNREVRIQAFLILLESKNADIIKKLIYTLITNRKYIPDFMAFLGYVNEKSFLTFFYILKQIGFDKTPQHIEITSSILNYIASNMLEECAKEFYNLKSYNKDLQKKILSSIRYFPSAYETIIKLYQEKYSIFYTNGEENADLVGFTFLLQKNEDIAFKCLRNPQAILNANSHGVFYLNKFGDKHDSILILDAIKNNHVTSKTLYTLLEQTRTDTNPILYNGLISYIKMSDFQLNKRLHFTLTLQYKQVVDTKLCESIQKLLSRVGNNPEAYDTMSRTDKKLISSEYLFHYWDNIFSKYGHLSKTQEKISISSGKIHNIFMYLDEYPYNGSIQKPMPEHDALILYTGKYFPYDNTGFYSKFATHIKTWKLYINENLNSFNVGRWYRYSHYTDTKETS